MKLLFSLIQADLLMRLMIFKAIPIITLEHTSDL
jgi:hypothetical protein